MRDELEQLANLAEKFFKFSDAEREQALFVRKVLRSLGYYNLGCGVIIAAIAAFLVPVLLIWAKTLPMGGRVPVFTFALGLAVFPLVLLYKAVRSLFSSGISSPASSLEEALERFFQKALGDSTKSLTAAIDTRADLLKYTVPLFPKPVFEIYLREIDKVATAWEEFRKRFAKEDEAFVVRIKDVVAKEKRPSLYEVAFKIFDTPFDNLAFKCGSHWYLLEMYPSPSETERSRSKVEGR